MSTKNTPQATTVDHSSILINLIAHQDISRALTEMGLDESDDHREILKSFLVKWDEADCDDEGATPSQDENLDKIIEATIDELI